MQAGFFKSLFDLSFTSFVTTKLIKVLYVLTLVLLLLGYLITTVGAFVSGGDNSAITGLLWMFIIGPLFLFFYTLIWRVIYELVIVIFRVFENTRDLLALERAAFPDAARQIGTGTQAESVQPPPPTGPPSADAT